MALIPGPMPLIAVPTQMPNGGKRRWNNDPYFKTTTANNGPWQVGAGNGVLEFRETQLSSTFNQVFALTTEQATTDYAPITVGAYIDIDEVNGEFTYFMGNSFYPFPMVPGLHYISQTGGISTGSEFGFNLYVPAIKFIPNPTFGPRPDLGPMNTAFNSANDYTFQLTASQSYFDAQGRLHIKHSTDCIVQYRAPWAVNADVQTEITLDYVSPGAALRIMSQAGGSLGGGDKTVPGEYRTITTYTANTGGNIQIALVGAGEIIISRFFSKVIGATTWQGLRKLRLRSLFYGEESYINQILFPKTKVLNRSTRQGEYGDLIGPTQQPNRLGWTNGPLAVNGNLVINSYGSVTGWNNYASGGPLTPVNLGFVDAPDGSKTAARIKLYPSTPAQTSEVYIGLASQINPCSVSVWLRSEVDGLQIALYNANSDPANSTETQFLVLSRNWQKYSLLNLATKQYLVIGSNSGTPVPGGFAGGVIDVWLPTIVNAATIPSDIATQGAAMPPENNPYFYGCYYRGDILLNRAAASGQPVGYGCFKTAAQHYERTFAPLAIIP